MSRAPAAHVASLVARRQACHDFQLLADLPFNDLLAGLAATAEGRCRAVALADRAEKRTSAGCLGASETIEDRGQVSPGHRRMSTAAVNGSGGKIVCVTLRKAKGALWCGSFKLFWAAGLIWFRAGPMVQTQVISAADAVFGHAPARGPQQHAASTGEGKVAACPGSRSCALTARGSADVASKCQGGKLPRIGSCTSRYTRASPRPCTVAMPDGGSRQVANHRDSESGATALTRPTSA